MSRNNGVVKSLFHSSWQERINRDYAATLATAVKNGFGTSFPGKNPPKFLFLKPDPLVGDMIAQVSLKKKYFFSEFWAYLTPRIKIPQCCGA
jgi:hypothetical protein